MLGKIIYIIFHFKQFFFPLIQNLGNWSYIFIFIIIFMETGLVIFPFLPGESLIFFASTIASIKDSVLNIKILVPVFLFAALVGDIVNFEIGKHLKQLTFFEKHLTKKRLASGIKFYQHHGGKTVIFGRFMPLIRTFIPLISGTIGMSSKKFLFYNFIGVIIWTGLGSMLGYYFGQVPFVQKHFSKIFIGIIVITLIPAFFISLNKLIKKIKAKY